MRAGTRGGLGPRDWETQRSLEQREVLTVFLFGEGESEQVEDWRAALERLADDQLLWLALRDPTEEDVTALQEELELGEENARRLLEQPSRASLADAGGRMVDRDRTVSRRSEPSSRNALMGEQHNPWDLLQPQDAPSRHRGAKPFRRCGLLGRISLLSPEYLLSVERRQFHSLPSDH